LGSKPALPARYLSKAGERPEAARPSPSPHLLEAHDLGRRLFDEVQRHLAAKGLKVATGTIVDVTIINAPSSTKNADKARDPEMHRGKTNGLMELPELRRRFHPKERGYDRVTRCVGVKWV
jgi:hypothetical protein